MTVTGSLVVNLGRQTNLVENRNIAQGPAERNRFAPTSPLPPPPAPKSVCLRFSSVPVKRTFQAGFVCVCVCGGGGGGGGGGWLAGERTGGSNLPPPFFRSPFSIAKLLPLLPNFCLFLPLSALLKTLTSPSFFPRHPYPSPLYTRASTPLSFPFFRLHKFVGYPQKNSSFGLGLSLSNEWYVYEIII